MTPINSANNIVGTLHQTYSGGLNGISEYFLRVKTEDGFEDYYITHSDLTIQIQDEDAFIYKTKDGTLILDHSPQTLGM